MSLCLSLHISLQASVSRFLSPPSTITPGTPEASARPRSIDDVAGALVEIAAMGIREVDCARAYSAGKSGRGSPVVEPLSRWP